MSTTFTFSVYCINLTNGLEPHKISFSANVPELSQALYALVSQRPNEFGDCRFITTDKLAPVSFDQTLAFSTDAGRVSYSDFFGATYNQLHAKINQQKQCDNYLSSNRGFCRLHNGRSGKAGEFFTFHDKELVAADEFEELANNKKFNNPDFYWG